MIAQHTVYAATEADILALLGRHQILSGAGQPRQGMGYAYRGPWCDSHGAAMASVCGLIWWTAEPQSDGEAQERADLLAALRADGALYEGPAPIYGMGTTGYTDPTGWEWIKRERDARRLRCGVQAGGKWFHSDSPSRDLYAQAAALVALGAQPSPVPWKTMDGSFTPMTQTLLTQVLGALAVSDTTHHVIAEQARAQLTAGTLTDLSAIPWPAGYSQA